jgi:homoserine O-acetyltransferase
MQYFYQHNQVFNLEEGGSLDGITIAYHTYGTLNKDKSNVIWVCHALTASADAADWWKGIVGKGEVLDTEKYFIICANILGSCYGTTGPLSEHKESKTPYYNTFPFITIRDMVKAHMLLREHLGIEQIYLLAGGSMGGYQALEWAVLEPARISNLFLLATSATESAWGIAIHTAQRLAIAADATFGEHHEQAGAAGLKAARAIGLLTYRNHELMVQQQTDTDTDKTDNFKASSYINYQGDKLVNRFNAYSYWTLGKAMDTHNIARKRSGQVASVLQQIQQPTLLIGISSDILCPPSEQRTLARHLPQCRYEEIDSQYGHDGFLIEADKIGKVLTDWLAERN